MWVIRLYVARKAIVMRLALQDKFYKFGKFNKNKYFNDLISKY